MKGRFCENKRESMKGKFFKFVKWVTIVAMVCTLFLTGMEIYSSTLNQDASVELLAGIQAFMRKLLKPDEELVPPEKLTIDQMKLGRDYYFCGDKVKLDFHAFPANADTAVTYQFEFEYGGGDEELLKCSVDEEGYFCYTGTNGAKIIITATSVHDASVQHRFYLYYRGINPTAESVERISMNFYDGSTVCAPNELKVGKLYQVYPTLYIKDEYLEAYGLTNRAVKSTGLVYDISFENGAENELYKLEGWGREVTFCHAYTGRMNVKFLKGFRTYFEETEGVCGAEQNVAIFVEEPNYAYLPTQPLVPDRGEYDEERGEYVINVSAWEEYFILKSQSQGDKINTAFDLYYLDEESENVATINTQNHVTRKVNRGVCNMEMVSIFDDTLRTRIRVNFEGYTPEKLNVYIDKTLAVLSSFRCEAEFEEDLYNENEVSWTVLEGANKVELDGNILTTKHLGKVVLRAQSVAYPEIYKDVEIEIKLWTSFESFVRKMIGHFLMFTFLGVGYFVCYFFLIKKRWLAFMLTPASVFALAAVTECIQGGVPGRGKTWYDVLINSCGGLLGMTIAVAIIGLVWFLRRKSPSVQEVICHISWEEIFARKKKLAGGAMPEKAVEAAEPDASLEIAATETESNIPQETASQDGEQGDGLRKE